ncbi:hypothetical protein AB0M43_14765 [Longispora sp. NPDC051575]|uniref:hypothetical protein n=1 Tax=Longispora sp. NPDC051575 TaxID=3154943 RepID=UPI003446E7C2
MTEDWVLPQGLGAIVLDTNCLGGGLLNMSKLLDLRQIIHAKMLGLEVWIPEPVLWEWAEHAQREYDELDRAVRSRKRRLELAGVEIALPWPGDPMRASAEQQVICGLEALPEPFKILRLKDRLEVAAQALQDQILVRPPAKRKEGVKTGVADIAMLRLAIAEAEERSLTILIVSGDNDIHRALKEWKYVDRIPQWPSLLVLRSALLNLKPAPEAVLKAIFDAVLAYFEQVRTNERSLGELQERGVVDEALGAYEEYLSTDLEVELLGNLALVHSVELDEEARYGTARALAIGNISVTGWHMDRWGEQLVSESGTVYDAPLSMEITFTLAESGITIEFDSVTVHSPSSGYSDEDYALYDQAETLALVPGLEELADSGLDVLRVNREWTAEVKGKAVTVTVSPRAEKDDDYVWSMSIDIDGQSVSVECYARDTWVGGTDGIHMASPYIVRTQEGVPAEFLITKFALSKLHGISDDGVYHVPHPHD